MQRPLQKDLRARLRDAEERRRAFPGPENRLADVDAWRIVNGQGDRAPSGLSLDRYRDVLVLAATEELRAPIIDAYAEAAVACFSPRALVLKVKKKKAAESESRVLYGEVEAEPMRVREMDATFLCDLDRGLQTGLFLDHRETRIYARRFAEGAEVLNLFSYTGAFSVHAGLAGAKRVTSVDSSRRALSRGRENMRESGLDPDAHRWFADDVKTHLSRGRAAYDLIILDPPVFGRAGKERFSLLEAMRDLIELSLKKCLPGGVLVVSTHARRVTPASLWRTIQEAAKRAARPVERLRSMGLPAWDHPVRPGSRGDYLKTLVLRVA